MSTEQPRYTVVRRDGEVEYRRYAPYLVAETVVRGGSRHEDAGSEGFMRLFRYITGANRSRREIAMTAPVAQGETAGGETVAMTAPVEQSAAKEGWRVAFMVPSTYDMETVPEPTDPEVRIRELPEKLVAVLRYSGSWRDEVYRERLAELERALESAGVEPAGPAQVAMYDSPSTPPAERHNEVMLPVKALPGEAR